jgi:asparagine synthetase B (glutamine-hydrolysing)
MCSFIFSDKKILNLNDVNFFTKFRGPDNTNHIEISGYSFVHNLLSITGEYSLQPFVEDDIVCIYNGEIYDYEKYGNYKSDGECLIPLYKKNGKTFIRELDGEFALILMDLSKNILILSTDTFKTKPIFYSVGKYNLSCSTYITPLEKMGYSNIKKMEPNTTLIIDLTDGNIIESLTVTEFNLNQHKNNYDDWNLSFKESIRKRTKNLREKLFLGLSGGYDSGAICCELLNQDIPFSTYTVIGTENENILNKRFNLMENKAISTRLTKNPDEISIAHNYIELNTEPFKYITYSNSSDYNEYWLSLIDDNGANHLSHVCSKAIKEGKKIFLSGQGADEIFSDYGFGGIKKYNHSNFGGLYPNNLSTIFPWPSFFNSSMESYLAKEEYVAGSYGIEARYPFLDKKVVQEFLWLNSDLKNLHYKSVLYNYLTENNYPFTKDEKIGF